MRILLTTVLVASFTISISSCASWKKQEDSTTQAKMESQKLEGSSWVLSSIPGMELETTLKPVTLQFSAEQRVGGHGGCNGFGGKYTQDGGKLSFSQLLSTKMACNPGMETENAYMNVLNETNGFVIKDRQLELQKDGNTLAILKPADNKK